MYLACCFYRVLKNISTVFKKRKSNDSVMSYNHQVTLFILHFVCCEYMGVYTSESFTKTLYNKIFSSQVKCIYTVHSTIQFQSSFTENHNVYNILTL